MAEYKPYTLNNGKLLKVTEDGLRINFYPSSGVVTTQLPGQSHSLYSNKLMNDFSNMNPQQMSNYAFGLFNTNKK